MILIYLPGILEFIRPTTWYLLSHFVGGTGYPGLVATSQIIYSSLRAIHVPVDIRSISLQCSFV